MSFWSRVFGLESKKEEPQVATVQDRVPEIRVAIPDTRPIALMPNVRNPVLGYNDQRRDGRGNFKCPEYDLAEIGRIEDTDSYVRQAFDKKTALMFKEGWDLVGKNPRTIKYIKTRLAQIARASGIPTNTLFRNVGSNVVRKSNAFLVKVRKTEASGGKVRTLPGKNTTLKPVAGYFPVPGETMEFQMINNKVTRWKQKMPSGLFKEYNIKDIIHINYDKKDGFVFGTPTLIPVVDDVRALRKIEENIELLIYQHLFPLFQYKVGTENAPAGYTEDGRREIDVVKQEIMFMPTEGGIVTPERHEITAIGSEGRALRAEGYLEHFKARVFSGLGVSAVDMGEGDTANRATADNMSRNLVDAVKDLQQILEDAINHEIIEELLLESTFGQDVLDEDNIVRLKFKEIDIEAQIKREAHSADQFAKDVITWDEARSRMGLEPITIPTPEEVQSGQDHPDTYPEWHRTRWKLFKLPELLIQSIDEPYSPIAQATARDNSTDVTSSDLEEAGKKKMEQEVEMEKERTKAKVAVAKATPRAKTTDGFLANTYAQVKSDVIKQVATTQTIDHDWTSSLVRTQLGTAIDRLLRDQLLAFRKGYASMASVETQQFIQATATARLQLRNRAENFVNKLTENLVSSLRRNVKVDTADPATVARAVFNSMEYRTKFIEDVEVRKASALGHALALRDTNASGQVASYITNDNACATCTSKNGQAINLSFLDVEMLPPHHANCNCQLQTVQATLPFQDSVKDNADKPLPEQQDSGDVATCPKCGKTAIRKTDTPDTFNCRACKTSFKKQSEKVSKTPDDQNEMPGPIKQFGDSMEDSGPGSKRAQYRRCISKAKQEMKSKNPTLDEDAVTAAAEIACYYLLDEASVDDTDVEDATLEECVLSVKKSLRKDNPDMSADEIKSRAFAICNSRMKKGK